MERRGRILSTILERMVLPLGDVFTRQKVMKYYRFFKATQYWPKQALVAYRERKLKELVNIAFSEVPFYRELYGDHKVDVRKITSLSDIRSLPIVTKQMLKDAYPRKCVRDTGQPWVELFTSGSTGAPFCVRVDYDTLSENRALMMLRASFSGWRPGDRFLQTGMTLDRGIVKKLKDIVLRAEYVSAFDLTNRALDRHIALIREKKIRYLMGYAASLFCIAKRVKERGLSIKFKGVVSWGDNLYAHYRRLIESVFGCRVTDTYGCGEGIQVAAQCERGNYHVFEPHVIVEFVDSKGEPVEEGQIGHIILTRLNPGAMPLIRYRVGDIGVPGGDCNCGCNYEVMKSIEGRDSDIIVTSRGNRLIVHFFTGIFEYEKSIKEFLVIQEKIGEILIKVVPDKGFRESVLDKLAKEIKAKGARDLNVSFEIVNEIPAMNSGKRRFVVNRALKEGSSYNDST